MAVARLHHAVTLPEPRGCSTPSLILWAERASRPRAGHNRIPRRCPGISRPGQAPPRLGLRRQVSLLPAAV